MQSYPFILFNSSESRQLNSIISPRDHYQKTLINHFDQRILKDLSMTVKSVQSLDKIKYSSEQSEIQIDMLKKQYNFIKHEKYENLQHSQSYSHFQNSKFYSFKAIREQKCRQKNVQSKIIKSFKINLDNKQRSIDKGQQNFRKRQQQIIHKKLQQKIDKEQQSVNMKQQSLDNQQLIMNNQQLIMYNQQLSIDNQQQSIDNRQQSIYKRQKRKRIIQHLDQVKTIQSKNSPRQSLNSQYNPQIQQSQIIMRGADLYKDLLNDDNMNIYKTPIIKKQVFQSNFFTDRTNFQHLKTQPRKVYLHNQKSSRVQRQNKVFLNNCQMQGGNNHQICGNKLSFLKHVGH